MAMGFNPQYRITNRMTKALTTIERARGFLEAAELSEAWVQEMSASALVREAHHTTHIEGTQLTMTQAEQLWRGEPVPEADANDSRELLNYRDAFEFVSDCLKAGDPITEGLIREIHRLLVTGVRGSAAGPGAYRTVQNAVANSVTHEVIYMPPEEFQVPILMSELVAWLNKDSDDHDVIISAIAQFQLVHIHPFLDGNGRTSRLLSTLCLYRSGYDFKRLFTISEFYDRDRQAFYSALQGVRDNGMDLTGWLEYFLEGLETQLTEVRGRGERIIRRDVLVHEHGLNERQAGILALLMEQGQTVQDLESRFPDVAKRTLQRDLSRLEEAGLVYHLGQTTGRIYALTKSSP